MRRLTLDHAPAQGSVERRSTVDEVHQVVAEVLPLPVKLMDNLVVLCCDGGLVGVASVEGEQRLECLVMPALGRQPSGREREQEHAQSQQHGRRDLLTRAGTVKVSR